MNISIFLTAVISKKGKAMERKLMKGFNIGKVEGILESVVTEDKAKGKNFFSNLAKAMNRKSKKDWNSKASRSGSGKRDQIGSSRQSMNRSNASIKRRIDYENDQLLQSMNPDQIVEYNPNLQAHTDRTKIAYAKFKVGTIRADKLKQKAEGKTDSVTVEKETKPLKPKGPNGVSKNALTSSAKNVDPNKKQSDNKTDPQPGKATVPSAKPAVTPGKAEPAKKAVDQPKAIKTVGPPTKPESEPKAEPLKKTESQPKTPTDPPKPETSKATSPKAPEVEKPVPKPAPPKPAVKKDDSPPFNPNGKSATTGKPVKGWL